MKNLCYALKKKDLALFELDSLNCKEKKLILSNFPFFFDTWEDYKSNKTTTLLKHPLEEGLANQNLEYEQQQVPKHDYVSLILQVNQPLR